MTEILVALDFEKSKPKLQRIAEMSRGVILRMRDTVWAIDVRKDNLEDLIDRMHEQLTPIDIHHDVLFDGQWSSSTKRLQDHRPSQQQYADACYTIRRHFGDKYGSRVYVEFAVSGLVGLEAERSGSGTSI